jgi:hypothetical protein
VNKKLLIPIALLMLVGMDLIALDVIKSGNEGLYLYGWLMLLASIVIFAIIALNFLSAKKSKR